MTVDYTELECHLTPREPWTDILIAELADAGFESFAETEDGLKAYIRSDQYDESAIGPLMDVFSKEGEVKLSYTARTMGGQNWNAVWESHFEPVTVAGQCLIRAPFHDPVPGMKYDIVIEPKMSFGTGHHETTALVVEFLLEMDIKGKAVLDMGCGTGVLAILSARMGAAPVTAIDNYVYAYENTVENARRNAVDGMRIFHGDAGLLGDEYYDLIIANITRNVLLEDMEKYSSVLLSQGEMLLSGFLSFDRDTIFARAESLGLSLLGEKRMGDWVCLRLTKSIKHE